MNVPNYSDKFKRRFIVFSDDWGRHPSSCQHIFKVGLTDYDVIWVNTIGMRPPRFDWTTLHRAAHKLGSWIRPSLDSGSLDTEEEACPHVLNPKMWPWMRSPLDREFNKRLLKAQIHAHVTENTIGVTTIPITCDLMDELSLERWVYYCVDDFSEWPGLDQKAMLTLETGVIDKADTIIAASQSLQNRLHDQFGRKSSLLTHGVDLDFWQIENEETVTNPFSEFEKPIMLFWGIIDQRLDYYFLKKLNDSITQGTILLVGPQQNPDPGISQLNNVNLLPPVSYQDLPKYGHFADVLIMPYLDSPVTQAMQPLKLLEYLATYRPAVVRSLPSTERFKEMLTVVENADEFAAAVNWSVESGISNSQKAARASLQRESWDSKAKQFFEIALTSCE